MNARPGNYTINLTFVVSEAVIDLSKLEADFTAKNRYTLTGTLGSAGYKITISDDAEVTLRSADITTISTSNNCAGITPLGDATIILDGTNKVKGGHSNYPGIFAAMKSTLTIKGTGALDASSNGEGAGIGGGDFGSCGSVTITSGVTSVTTTKGGDAPNSIGAGVSGSCGTVTVGGVEGAITESPYTYTPNP